MNHRFSPLFLGLLLAGCSPWEPVALSPREDPPAFRTYQVWLQDGRQDLRALRIRNDTLSGIPEGRSFQCEECRIRLRMDQVDSIRTAGQPALGAAIIGGAGGAVSAILLVVAAMRGT
ncbi:MAG: hypothetical protein AB7I33_02050 [Gemmatimonadales bacterium]